MTSEKLLLIHILLFLMPLIKNMKIEPGRTRALVVPGEQDRNIDILLDNYVLKNSTAY